MKAFRILVLEDVVVTSVAISRSLETDLPDCIVLRAQSLFEARLLLKTYDIDFFILDIQLPDGSGIEFLQDIANKSPKARVVIVTGTPLPQYQKQASEFGVLHFMGKPIDVPLLRRLARESKGVATTPDTSFSGSLKKLTVMDVVQLKCLARATVRLDFTNRSLDLVGRIFLDNGEITHAEVSPQRGSTIHEGEKALAEILGWRGGQVEEVGGSLPAKRTIHAGWQSVLLNAAQLVDEHSPQTDAAASPS